SHSLRPSREGFASWRSCSGTPVEYIVRPYGVPVPATSPPARCRARSLVACSHLPVAGPFAQPLHIVIPVPDRTRAVIPVRIPVLLIHLVVRRRQRPLSGAAAVDYEVRCRIVRLRRVFPKLRMLYQIGSQATGLRGHPIWCPYRKGLGKQR